MRVPSASSTSSLGDAGRAGASAISMGAVSRLWNCSQLSNSGSTILVLSTLSMSEASTTSSSEGAVAWADTSAPSSVAADWPESASVGPSDDDSASLLTSTAFFSSDACAPSC